MFTVIICSADFIANIQGTYSHILEALSKNDECALCAWNTQADTFEEALPDLPKIIVGKSQWRAVVIHDAITFGLSEMDKRNPFDKVGSVKVIQDFNENTIFNELEEMYVSEKVNGEVDPEQLDLLDSLVAQSSCSIKEYRQKKKEKYISATGNPLTRLGIWLTGVKDKQPDISSSLPEVFFDDTAEINRNYYEMLWKQGVLASEVESYHMLKYRYETLASSFPLGAMVINQPETILVISERINTHADDTFYSKPGEYEELEYSNFCDDNLYVGRMRFLFFDIDYENGRKNAKDYLAFLTAIVAFGEHDVPSEAVRAGRVYRMSLKINEKKVVDYYAHYLSKLYRTRFFLQSACQRRIDKTLNEEVPREEAQALFESDITIPVVINKENKKTDLMGKYKDIGLSRDCPGDEYNYWYNQVHQIMKNFMRYIREPRRALNKAVKTDFRSKSVIDDERAINLDETQLEDVQICLLEEEQKMVETTTESLFKTKQYTDEIEKADREVRKGISQRMTKKKTVYVSLIALLAYFFGFLPVIFSNLNTVKSFMFSLGTTGIMLVAFMAVGFVYLFALRKKIVNRIKHFNYVMSGIIGSIESGLKDFSRYLSHACNVMREYSVLISSKRKEDIKLNVLKKHIVDIDEKIKETEAMFVDNSSFKLTVYEDEDPFDYDFTVCKKYTYDVPYYETDSSMLFVNKENWVSTSIGYLDSITLTREELYD